MRWPLGGMKRSISVQSTIVPVVINRIFIGMESNRSTQAALIDLKKTLGLTNHQLWLFKADSMVLGRPARTRLHGQFPMHPSYALHNGVKGEVKQLAEMVFMNFCFTLKDALPIWLLSLPHVGIYAVVYT